MNKFQFKKTLSRKSAAEKSAAAATTSEATGSAGESLLRVAREMSNALSVKETQSQGSEDQEAAGSIQAINPEGESQEFQISPSGTQLLVRVAFPPHHLRLQIIWIKSPWLSFTN